MPTVNERSDSHSTGKRDVDPSGIETREHRARDEPSDAPSDEYDTAGPTEGEEAPPEAVVFDALIGTTVAGGYVIKQRIGAGGMSDVYRADHPVLRRSVAVKVMQDRSNRSKDLAFRFLNEARAIAILSHRNIVDVFDSGFLNDGSPFIVMEFLLGETLSQRVRRGTVVGTELLLIALQLCDGMVRAHREGIIHRDLKPGNVFLADQNGEVVLKILDFGIAKLLNPTDSHDSDHKTRTHAILGTPQYMSPEQARRSAAVTPATDVYSMGVILFRLITGKLPYRISSAGELVFYVLSRRGVVADFQTVPRDWRSTLKKCMAVKPENRFASAEELLVDIIAHVDGAADVARQAMPTEAPALLERSGAVRGRRRRRAAARGLAVVALVAAAAVGIGVGADRWRAASEEDAVVESVEVAEVEPALDVAEVVPDEPVAAPVDMVPTPVDVLFVSQPPGAQLRILELETRFRAPERVELPPGEYRIVATKEGYARTLRSIEIVPSSRRVVIHLGRTRGTDRPSMRSSEMTPETSPSPTPMTARNNPNDLFQTRN